MSRGEGPWGPPPFHIYMKVIYFLKRKGHTNIYYVVTWKMSSPQIQSSWIWLFENKDFYICNYVKDLQLSSSWIIPISAKSNGK